MLTLLFVFLTTVCLFTLLTYTLFWYETANRAGPEEHPGIPGHRAVSFPLLGILSSLVSVSLLLVTYPLGLRKGRCSSKPARTGDPRPVILVHGLYHNAAAWVLYKHWLRSRGITNLHTFQYSSWSTNFDRILADLTAFIKHVRSLEPDQPIVLIGHSLGGLLCRAFEESSPERAGIAAVVTLGTPHQGSKLSVLGLGGLARSLSYRGPLIRELERRRMHSDTPRLAVYSAADNMVLPLEGLMVPYQGWHYHEAAPISHVSLLYHRRGALKIVDFIQRTA